VERASRLHFAGWKAAGRISQDGCVTSLSILRCRLFERYNALGMDTRRLERLLENERTFWLIAAFTIVLFLITNLPWQLDDHDQAKQAFTSFEMVKEGHWFYQHTPHEQIATKPPLVGWFSAAVFALTRSWDIAWRLPSFLAAIAIFFLLWRAASSTYGPVAGLIASSAFGLNLLSPRLAMLVRTDMPLALVIFLLGLLIWRKIREREPWNARDRLSVFALLTAAMLIKGPIVYAFLLPGIALFQWRKGRVGALRRPDPAIAGRRPYESAWCGWWPWIASLVVFLLWVIGGIFFEPDFFDQVVMREFLARFGESVHRPQPLLFYVPHLLLKFFPWSALIIAIAIADLRARRQSDRDMRFESISPRQPASRESSGAPGDTNATATLWLVCWIFGGLVVMSLVPSKRVDRIFPLIPPLCLLLAAQIGKDAALPRKLSGVGAARRPYLAVVLAVSILFTGGYTLSKVLSGYRDGRDSLAVFGRAVRKEVATHHWRYEVVRSRDEAMLLYLQKTHFVEPETAVVEWNRKNLDALVVPPAKAPALMGELHGAMVSAFKPNGRKSDLAPNYVLIVRGNTN
jgi:4-amino-4-deoxy-L-arabinose transferase-like glycosyltransferase